MPGPPRVMIWIGANTWNEEMNVVITRKNVVGERKGMVILKNLVISPAPSMSAAS